MTYSYLTHSKHGDYYILLFINDMEDIELKVKFLPTISLPFSRDNIDLQSMKLRDPEMILYMLESCGLTMILEGK